MKKQPFIKILIHKLSFYLLGSSILLNFILISKIYFTFGSKIEIFSNFGQIGSLISVILIFFIFFAGLFALYYDLNFYKLMTGFFSIFLYKISLQCIIALNQMYYNIANYEDIILTNKYFLIIYNYNYDDVVTLIPFWYKNLTGLKRLFTEEEIHKIIDKATTATEVKTNLFNFLINENKIITHIEGLSVLDAMAIGAGTAGITILIVIISCVCFIK